MSYAVTKYVRVSPKKARLVANSIKNLPVEEALFQLSYGEQKSCKHLEKTLKSAIANAEVKLDVKREELKVHEVRVDEGPAWKRAKARSRGGRSPILKRTSHLKVVVASKN